jgi:hypothetical protein
MKKVKVILPAILPVLLITGILAVSGHADKPESPPGLSKPKPEPILISVTGAIDGEGAPENISVEFMGGSFGEYAGSYVANPDYPPALKISGPGRHRSLSYYYCDSADLDHSTTEDGICNDDGHDPDNYKNLRISNGRLVKKTDKVIFPAGSRWRITQKIVDPTTGDVTGEIVAEGTLAEDVTYEVLEWSTP